MTTGDPLSWLRARCLALPEACEVAAWGEPTFRVRGRMFAMYASPGRHHGAGRAAVWIKAAPANQAPLVAAEPARYFVPPYVGARGWIGAWLDGAADRDAVDSLLRDAYRRTAPKRLAALVPGDDGPAA